LFSSSKLSQLLGVAATVGGERRVHGSQNHLTRRPVVLLQQAVTVAATVKSREEFMDLRIT
jgi:hypothetical protein